MFLSIVVDQFHSYYHRCYHHQSIDRWIKTVQLYLVFLRNYYSLISRAPVSSHLYTLCHLSSHTNIHCVKILNIPCSSTEVITTHRCLHISLCSSNGSVHRMCKDNHHVATPSFRMNESDLKNNFKPLNHLITTSFLLIGSPL